MYRITHTRAHTRTFARVPGVMRSEYRLLVNGPGKQIKPQIGIYRYVGTEWAVAILISISISEGGRVARACAFSVVWMVDCTTALLNAYHIPPLAVQYLVTLGSRQQKSCLQAPPPRSRRPCRPWLPWQSLQTSHRHRKRRRLRRRLLRHTRSRPMTKKMPSKKTTTTTTGAHPHRACSS